MTNLSVANASVAAGSTGKGAGGTLTFAYLGQLTITGAINANGAPTGQPGKITLTQTATNTMQLSGATITALAGASPDTGTTQISISSPASIVVAGTIIDANAVGTGNAQAGSISITAGNAIDLTQPNTFITAEGAQNGPGGSVTINPTATFDINSVIEVSAGSSVTNTSVFDGSIGVNGVTCQQWLTSTPTSWLSSYWNCINPTEQNDITLAPSVLAASLTSAVKTQLGNSHVQIYEFSSENAYLTFTQPSAPPPAGAFGWTWIRTTNQFIYTGIFPTNPTADNMEEVTAHELGHTEDYNANLQSQSTDYQSSWARDFANLDFTVVGTSYATSIYRDACVPDGGQPAPFVGATSENPAYPGPICTGGVLNRQFFNGTTPWSNSEIAINTGAALSATSTTELYAQQFSIVTFVNTLKSTPADMLNQTTDILIVENNYMPCTNTWASNRATGSTSEPSFGEGSLCLVDPGQWYTIGAPRQH